jgi:hypothetical protein
VGAVGNPPIGAGVAVGSAKEVTVGIRLTVGDTAEVTVAGDLPARPQDVNSVSKANVRIKQCCFLLRSIGFPIKAAIM